MVQGSSSTELVYACVHARHYSDAFIAMASIVYIYSIYIYYSLVFWPFLKANKKEP